MYKIGELSKIVDMSIKTLRYYDECGILKPSRIDSFTGYRYYDEQSILDCELIKLLKSLDFTLEEIIQYKDNVDEEIISKKKKELEERMYLLKLKYKRLLIMEEELKSKVVKKIVKETPKEKVLRRKYEKRNIRRNY